MSRWAAVVGVLVLGCGGASREAAAPSDDASETDPAPASATPEEQEAEGGGASPESGASAEDVRTVLQLVLDDGELEPFLKLGEPGRFPFKIAGDGVPSDAELTKGPEPVVRVEDPSKEAAVLVFTKVDVGPESATIKYRYDVEGIRGTATLKKGEFGWALVNSRIIER